MLADEFQCHSKARLAHLSLPCFDMLPVAFLKPEKPGTTNLPRLLLQAETQRQISLSVW